MPDGHHGPERIREDHIRTPTVCARQTARRPNRGGGHRGDASETTRAQTLASSARICDAAPRTPAIRRNGGRRCGVRSNQSGFDAAQVRERVDWALELAGVSDLHDRNPFELSGGQQRLVAIAGIIACDPSVLVLDEPCAGLDTSASRRIEHLMQTLRDRGSPSSSFAMTPIRWTVWPIRLSCSAMINRHWITQIAAVRSA